MVCIGRDLLRGRSRYFRHSIYTGILCVCLGLGLVTRNPDGSFNELFGTPPDIKLEPADPPKSITREELLKDEWIKKIIDDM